MEAIRALVERLNAAARRSNHRAALVLAGDREWGRETAVAALATASPEGGLWVTDVPPAGFRAIDNPRLQRLLGSETRAIAYDAWSGLDPDGLGAVSGTLAGGGLLVLITPPLAIWPAYPDPDKARIATYPYTLEQLPGRFLGRLASLLRRDPGALVVEQGQPLPAPPQTTLPRHDPGHLTDDDCRTADQRNAVAMIEQVAAEQIGPLVLTSDRGRGKSSALGIAAAHLLRRGYRRVVVTAPRLGTANTVFEHAARLLPGSRTGPGHLERDGSRLHFASPDGLLRTPIPAELLMVDEAAAIPNPVLEGLLIRYPRAVFATTVHGYEGTGRGFAVRFRETLDRRAPDWRELRLETPIRWAPHDPLERLVFRALLLDAEPAAARALTRAADSVLVERLDRDRLAADERILTELFGLLVLAHYQTRPMDLRNLLDGPAIEVWVARCGDHVAGAAVVALEGGLDTDLARDSWLGRRRPRGHLIPESLASQAGYPEAAGLRGARIMRIAVHPALRRRGLGTRLLRAVTAAVRRDGLDYVGSSFGATADLLDFWLGDGFLPIRLGSRRDAASGTHSVMVARALSARADDLFGRIRDRFLDELPLLLAGPAADLETGLRRRLAPELPRETADAALEEQDWRDLTAFAYGNRLDDHCLLALQRLLHHAERLGVWQESLSPQQRGLYRQRVLHAVPWPETATSHGLSGRREGIRMLRDTVRVLLDRLAPEAVRGTVASIGSGRA